MSYLTGVYEPETPGAPDPHRTRSYYYLTSRTFFTIFQRQDRQAYPSSLFGPRLASKCRGVALSSIHPMFLSPTWGVVAMKLHRSAYARP